MSDKYLGQNLIFIISLPRSGSTLLQRVLAGHSDVGTSSEPWILLHQAYGRRATGISTDYGADWAALGVNEFVAHYTDGDEVYDDAVRAFARVLYDNASRKAGTRLFIDKTPRYVLVIDDLIRWFPAARFIFLLRNPLAVLASVLKTQISHDLTTLERFARELVEGPPALLRGIDALGERARVLRYEEFVTDPEGQTSQLCTWLGLEYSPAMLEYARQPEMQGFMQDRTGINQHTRPVRRDNDGWRVLLEDAQSLEFARGYLSALAPECVGRLGYSWQEMKAAVDAASRQRRPGFALLPWDVAIMSPEQKRGRDQFYVFRYRSYRDFGPLRGALMTAVRYLQGLGRVFGFIFSSGRRKRGGSA